MSSEAKRLDLLIDVFELKAQSARVLDSLKPAELIKAVLAEFQELDYLGRSVGDYQLLRTDSNAPLNEAQSLGEQLLRNDHLTLTERSLAKPAGAERPNQHLYLRDLATGSVYKLNWLPAIIGRWDEAQPNNNLLAVNLDGHAAGQRVSRRHAMIGAEQGGYWIESLSANATTVANNGETPSPIGSDRQPLQPGDLIRLERSGIVLKFIARAE